ncbi:hypothetical protein, partial [Cereibacter changlensis]|uniref:hypothetical protein n=1 Tax=Cereibacter changlensis TaxID=402884 RepID=UPI001B80D7E7
MGDLNRRGYPPIIDAGLMQWFKQTNKADRPGAAGCKLMKLAYADCPSLGEKTLFSKMVRKQFLDERSQGSLI